MKTVFLCALVFATSGCSYIVPKYSPSENNRIALNKLPESGIKVSKFVSLNKFNDMCRAAGSIKSSEFDTLEYYINDALSQELKIAGLLDNNSPRIVLSGKFKKIEFSSTHKGFDGFWKYILTINSSNGNSLVVEESYEFDTSFFGGTACRKTAEAFMPSVQVLINKIVNSNEFISLLN